MSFFGLTGTSPGRGEHGREEGDDLNDETFGDTGLLDDETGASGVGGGAGHDLDYDDTGNDAMNDATFGGMEVASGAPPGQAGRDEMGEEDGDDAAGMFAAYSKNATAFAQQHDARHHQKQTVSHRPPPSGHFQSASARELGNGIMQKLMGASPMSPASAVAAPSPPRRDAPARQQTHAMRSPQHTADMEERRRRRQMQAAKQMDRDGFMTNSDKTFIARMQKNQFENGVGAVDDFYAKAFNAVRQGKGGQPLPPELLRARPNDVDVQDSMRKMKSALNGGRRTDLQARGALGSIALTNIRNPKQLIKIKALPKVEQMSGATNKSQNHLSARIKMRLIESIFDVIMDIEDLFRSWSKEKAAMPNAANIFRHRYVLLKTVLWRRIGLDVDRLHRASSEMAPNIVQLLSSKKMQNLIPRLLPHMNSAEEALLLFYVITTNLSSLPGNIVSVGRHTGDDMESFLKTVIGPFLPVLSTPDCSMRWLIMLLQKMIAKGDVVYTSCCKVGCIVLTLIIHQAETRMATSTESNDWLAAVTRLLNALQGHFSTLFPSQTATLLPTMGSASKMNGPVPINANHVWALFAALASVSEEAAVLITSEVKDKVLEVIMNRDKDPIAVAGLNQFLNVMGLDDAMVMNA